ncbi:hypothetical protein KDJ56_04715 [Brevibacillus composti]|uniref:Uncharacterized protein n=1 Tax=Brevibacillus composti TaxID=2796470 RepID=A0A7T5EMD1_9BACL|nr:hypothetical protein [Brevibacillus composti]QQE75294.1 hypothetical protein JD108_05035 [Brevibacillus composti]QUO42321.1 hypothetical protein KDJ56_04715 [Brevibacillus composti]
MEEKLARYYQLKEEQKKIEEELQALRQDLLEQYAQAGPIRAGAYQMVVNYQERREYDDNRLYNALPDASLWRLVSRADVGKINSLLKLNVIHEGILEGTYERKQVPVIKVQKS